MTTIKTITNLEHKKAFVKSMTGEYTIFNKTDFTAEDLVGTDEAAPKWSTLDTKIVFFEETDMLPSIEDMVIDYIRDNNIQKTYEIYILK